MDQLGPLNEKVASIYLDLYRFPHAHLFRSMRVFTQPESRLRPVGCRSYRRNFCSPQDIQTTRDFGQVQVLTGEEIRSDHQPGCRLQILKDH